MEVVLWCGMDIPGMLWHNITGMGGTNLSGGFISQKQKTKVKSQINSKTPIQTSKLLNNNFDL